MGRKQRDGETGKIIDLPNITIAELEKLAKKERMKVKPYMEKVLIEHPKKRKNGMS